MLLLGSVALCGLLAIAVVSDSSLMLGGPPPGLGELPPTVAKGLLGVALPCAFLAVFVLARAIDRRGWPAAFRVMAQVAAFATAGATAGLAVIGFRAALGGATPFAPALVAMHAGGFAVAYAAGGLSLRALRRRLPSIAPVIGTDAWGRQAQPTP